VPMHARVERAVHARPFRTMPDVVCSDPQVADPIII
jgi:hypothetical protein